MPHAISPCVDPEVDPLLAELERPVAVCHSTADDLDHGALQAFVRAVFRDAHDARVDHFHPQLIGFRLGGRLSAVLGYRDGGQPPLFTEQYLDQPVEALLAGGRRGELVEVGNLALASPGRARWVIAFATAFLAAAGYRWVLFTATTPLANAFRRLGLHPLDLGAADPTRLADAGAAWGRYYAGRPRVYAGDILAGERKLARARAAQSPALRELLAEACRLGRTRLADADADGAVARCVS